jgi:hypothetical protein
MAAAADPDLVLRRVERTGVSANTMTTSTGQTIYFGATPVTVVKYWAEDRAGNRVSAEDFALRVGEPALAEDIASSVRARRAVATPLMLAGAGGWVAGAALLLAANGSDATPAGALAVVGGQVSVVTGLVLSATNRTRRRRLDPWLEWNRAVELAPEVE